MKNLIILLAFLNSSAMAVTIEIKNICDVSAFHKEEIQVMAATNAGQLTVNSLSSHNIPFVGDETNITSILNTPSGTDAIEVLPGNKMRIYGWCYQVDGVQPDFMANEYAIAPQGTEHIYWFFAYSEYDQGKWYDYCTPVSADNEFICK